MVSIGTRLIEAVSWSKEQGSARVHEWKATRQNESLTLLSLVKADFTHALQALWR